VNKVVLKYIVHDSHFDAKKSVIRAWVWTR